MDPLAWLQMNSIHSDDGTFSSPRQGSRGSPRHFYRKAEPADWRDAPVPFELQEIAWSDAESAANRHVEPRPGREWISDGVVATGLALAAFGAWPRRRQTATTEPPLEARGRL